MLRRLMVSTLLLLTFVFAQWTETEIVPDGRLQEISILDDGTAYIAIGNQADTPYGGVLKSTDWGATWGELDCPAATTPTGMLSVDFWDANLGIVTGKDHIVMITRDSGASWETPAFESVNSFWVAKWLSATTVVTVGDSGKVFISEDAGVNWTTQLGLRDICQTVHSKAGCFDMAFIDENNWVSVGKKGAMAKTTDAGATWTLLAHTLGTPVFQDIDFIDADNWMIVGTNGSALKTTDAGASFTVMSINAAARFEALDYLDANNAMIGGHDGGAPTGIIYQTTDGGATWTDASIPATTGNSVRAIHMFDAATVIALGDLNPGGRIFTLGVPGSGTGNIAPTASAGVDQTVDEAGPGLGATITLDGSGSSDSDGTITAWDWSWDGGTASGETADVEFAAGTYAVTLTVTDDGGETATDEVIIVINVVVSVDGRMSPQAFALHANYPNPFNPTTQISYDLAESGLVDLTIYDVNGIEVSKLVQGYKSAGHHTLTFSADNLPSGIYVARLSSGIKSMTRKMILMK
ncbi:MAG: T9SS type A sorting domain-containing protein [FCB group bacterium]|nr:T9SS type A sorting domain-containing protein [FCB group bacterium]MBL7120400.1 T9SS type A sorting domain-containing protein [Candidatus Neomarinimicrobiota bacterium]